MNSPQNTAKPLEGLIVADLSRVLAGPYCSMLLADMGATVVKVESAAGDDTRTWVPPTKDGVATYYMSINRNKKSIVLDYGNPDDLEIVKKLVRNADICLENFKVGGLKKFGLDYESVKADNPGLIYLSISGFGTAEGAWLPGYDLIVQAVSGLMSLTGEPDGSPYRAGISVFDVMAGLHGTIGVLAALNHRNATGEGQHIEVNLLSSAMSGLVNQTAAYTAAGVVPFRMGNAHPACSRMKLCQQRIATSSLRRATTSSSDRYAQCWESKPSQMTHVSRSMQTAPRTAKNCARSCWRNWLSGCLMICSLNSTKLVCHAAPSTPSVMVWNLQRSWACARASLLAKAIAKSRWYVTPSHSVTAILNIACRHQRWASTPMKFVTG
jgi:crotonobetainyl-CoA:carnitine CoA-transferase CaiB-like acyl-CoA transferase